MGKTIRNDTNTAPLNFLECEASGKILYPSYLGIQCRNTCMSLNCKNLQELQWRGQEGVVEAPLLEEGVMEAPMISERTFGMEELEEWHLLVSKVSDIQLNHEVDSVNWALERNEVEPFNQGEGQKLGIEDTGKTFPTLGAKCPGIPV